MSSQCCTSCKAVVCKNIRKMINFKACEERVVGGVIFACLISLSFAPKIFKIFIV